MTTGAIKVTFSSFVILFTPWGEVSDNFTGDKKKVITFGTAIAHQSFVFSSSEK